MVLKKASVGQVIICIICLIKLLYYVPVSAQSFKMAKSLGGWVDDQNLGIGKDKDGNTYWIAALSSGVKIGTRYVQHSGNVLLKIDKQGNYIWFREIYDASYSNYVTDFHTDSLGNSILLMQGNRPTTCNDSIYSFDESYGSFFFKIDSAGQVKQCLGIPGYSSAMACDKSGNVFVTGTFSGTIRLGSFKLNSTPGSYNNTYDIFLTKISNNGSIDWACSFGSTSDEKSYDLALGENGDVLICGYLPRQTQVNFNNITHSTLTNDNTAFIASISNSGKTKWVRSAGNGSNLSYAQKIKIDNRGNIVVLGKFYGNFIQDIIRFMDQTAFFNYVSKYDNSGNIIWVRKMNPPVENYDVLEDIDIDQKNNIYVGLTFRLNFSIDNVYFSGPYTTSTAIVCLNDLGRAVWGKQLSGSYNTNLNKVKVDHSGKLYIGGDYNSLNLAFDQIGVSNNSGNSCSDAYLAELNIPTLLNCINTKFIPEASKNYLCDQDTVKLFIKAGNAYRLAWYLNDQKIENNLNSYVASVAGFYKVIINDFSVCADTSQSIELKQYTNPIAQIQSDKGNVLCPNDTLTLLTSYQPNTSYYWSVDHTHIAGISNQIKVRTPGTYQLVVNNLFCSNESSFTIVKKQLPDIDLGIDTLFCYGQLIELKANEIQGDSYRWYYNNMPNPFSVYNRIEVNKIGKFTLKAFNECGFDMDSVYLVSSIIDLNTFENNKLEIFPQPFRDNIKVTFSKSIEGALFTEVFTIFGQKVYESTYPSFNGKVLSINLNALLKGSYLLLIRYKNQYYTKKIIKI